MITSPLLSNVSHRAMITPVRPLLTRLIHIIRVRGTTSFISGGGNFHEIHSMTLLCLFERSATFSQTVTYNNNNVILPADTKSIVYKRTHSAQRWLIKTECFTTALEAESPVSSEISDLTP